MVSGQDQRTILSCNSPTTGFTLAEFTRRKNDFSCPVTVLFDEYPAQQR
jgi:hypothetical protein